MDFLWLLLALLVGVVAGVITGLIPGLHVNTVALLSLSLTPLLISNGIPIEVVAVAIVANGIVHTFLDYIPGALLGAPNDDTALSLLPAHRLLQHGLASRGVVHSATGSLLGMIMALPLLIVSRLLLGPELSGYSQLKEILPFVLLGIVVILLLTESSKMKWPSFLPFTKGGRQESRVAGILVATWFFLLSGMFGMAVFALPANSPVGIPSTLLMPALAGLFGLASLLDIWRTSTKMPKQSDDWAPVSVRPLLGPCATSSVAGGMMGVLPGMTAAQATVLSQSASKLGGKKQKERVNNQGEHWADLEVISSLSAVNTACTVMVLGFLFIVGRARSGAALALEQMMPIENWSTIFPPGDFVRLVGVTLASGLLAYPLAIKSGKAFLWVHGYLPQRWLIGGVATLVALLAFLSTGFIGLVVMGVGVFLGTLPPRLGIRRSHGMGLILLPVMLRLFELS